MQFTLKQLGYFVAAGETGSILKAARKIHVSQPSISNAISHLEEVFRVQLFVRHHARGMSLTSAGARLAEHARRLLRDADELHGLAGVLADRVYGTINVGCFIPLAPIVVPGLCHDFLAAHDGVVINVSEDDQSGLIRQLKRGAVDLALTYDLQLDGDVDFFPLAELEPYALLPAGHELAGQARLSLAQLAALPFILLDLPLSDAYFMAMFARDGIKPDIYARTRQIEVQRGLVGGGYGFSLANVRPLNRRSLDGSELAYVPLDDRHPGLTLGVAMLARQRKTLVIETFLDYCRDRIGDNRIPGMTNLDSPREAQ